MSLKNNIPSGNFSYEKQMEKESSSKVQTKPNLYVAGKLVV